MQNLIVLSKTINIGNINFSEHDISVNAITLPDILTTRQFIKVTHHFKFTEHFHGIYLFASFVTNLKRIKVGH